MALRAEDLARALRGAQDAVRKDQKRLAALGCNPGPADGHLGAQTLKAYDCERRKQGRG
jgi:peptidoglycan hydrolase-like protein with peptidoglycan-binding domain